jgi:hypothetical protein
MSAARRYEPFWWSALVVALALAVWKDLAAERALTALAASLHREAALVKAIGSRDEEVETLSAKWVRARSDFVRRPAPATGARADPAAEPTMSMAQARLARSIRANIELHYLFFLTKLGLSSARIAQWEAGAVEYALRLRDINTAVADQGLSEKDSSVAALRQTELAQWKSQEDQLLGTDAAAQLREFYRAAPVQSIVEEVAGHLLGSDTPLTAMQGTQLIQLLATSTPEYREGKTANPASINWDLAITQTSGVLSAAQLDALRAVSVDHQLRLQLQQRVTALH